MEQKPKRRILLGITGGIAAYKAVEFVRLATAANFDVQVVLTEAATQFVTPTTLQALSGNAVYSGLWDSRIANAMGHIELSRDAELILIAPASANFMAKLANGLADDLLSTLCLARACPLIIAPAMNREMWASPPTQRNAHTLRQDGIYFIEPEAGLQACGETGIGRMAEPAALLNHITALLAPKILQGHRVLVTAGPTFEAIDPVRAITNLSSGKMGYAVAQAAIDAGAEVTLISGPTALISPRAAKFISATSADAMYAAVMQEIGWADIFISAAAISDYKIATPAQHKIKKDAAELSLTLTPTKDILREVANLPQPPFCVGFAAETSELGSQVEDKRLLKNLPLIAANRVPQAFGSDENELVLYDQSGRHTLPRGPKIEAARALINHIAQMLRERAVRKPSPPTKIGSVAHIKAK